MTIIMRVWIGFLALVAIVAMLILGWIIYAMLRRWFWPHAYSSLGWLAQLERHITRWPRLLAGPYAIVKWTLVANGAYLVIMKAIDEVQRGQPGGGVAFAVGLPLAFLIHLMAGLNRERHRDGA